MTSECAHFCFSATLVDVERTGSCCSMLSNICYAPFATDVSCSPGRTRRWMDGFALLHHRRDSNGDGNSDSDSIAWHSS